MLTFRVSKSGDGTGNGWSPTKVYDSLSPMKTSIGIGANMRMWEERTGAAVSQESGSRELAIWKQLVGV